MKRKAPLGGMVTSTPKVLVNPHKPVVGLFIDAYFHRKEIGMGHRTAMVTQVGHKFVTLYHWPLLQQFRLTLKEWEALRTAKVLPVRKTYLRREIAAKAEAYTRYGKQYSERAMKGALRAISKAKVAA